MEKSNFPGHLNTKKTSITCQEIPETLFESEIAKKHFGKFGKVSRILMRPKSGTCVVEFELPESAEKAFLNAGAYDGFMFDVSWTKKKRKKSQYEEDPDWKPDSDIEDELLAMRTVPSPNTRLSGTSLLDARPKTSRFLQNLPQTKPAEVISTVMPTQTTMSTSEAANELFQLSQKASKTVDDMRRTLEARDRILRAWGGTGARVKEGGAVIGTCKDMCPEKEILQRQAEHQIANFECDAEGNFVATKALKQYSRSSADQETPMCYELRPPKVLTKTANYLLANIVPLWDKSNISLADWFHFLWDRFRSIRKDLTQQASCCEDAVRLVEQCARFHAHCGATLVSLSSAEFDSRLNTDNLTKCLQSLKHMYADLSDSPDMKPCEPEFRGYVALLNLNDTNFFWEIKRLPKHIQKSEPIQFAIAVFTAMDNNNYIKFFRLIKEKATYLQACILLRYFNDVRARALARLVKAFAPRGDSRYPAEELRESLGFQDMDSLQLFVENYGLSLGEGDDGEFYVVLNRKHFMEDSDPYPVERAVNLVESKLVMSLSEVLAGGKISSEIIREPHSSFDDNGMLNALSLFGVDQNYSTKNNTNIDIEQLKNEVKEIAKKGIANSAQLTKNVPKLMESGNKFTSTGTLEKRNTTSTFKSFSDFNSPAQPSETTTSLWGNSSSKSLSLFEKKEKENVFQKLTPPTSLFTKNLPHHQPDYKKIFGCRENGPADVFKQSNKTVPFPFSKPTDVPNVFGRILSSGDSNTNYFSPPVGLFQQPLLPQKPKEDQTLPSANLFLKPVLTDASPQTPSTSIFRQAVNEVKSLQPASANLNVPTFGEVKPPNKSLFDTKPQEFTNTNLFGKAFSSNKLDETALSANIGNIPSKIFGEAVSQIQTLEGDHVDVRLRQQEEQQRLEEIKRKELLKEKQRQIEERKRQEEEKILEEERRQKEARRQEELRKIEEQKRIENQRVQELLKQKLEEEKRLAELKRQEEEKARAAEEARKKAELLRQLLIAKINEEATELVEKLLEELTKQHLIEGIRTEQSTLENITKISVHEQEALIMELCTEICKSELKAENFHTNKLLTRFGKIWCKNTKRNVRRRKLVECTPVWLAEPVNATLKKLKRDSAPNALNFMQLLHRGRTLKTVLTSSPPLTSLNISEIVGSTLISTLKELNYRYGDFIYWKIAVTSVGSQKYLRYDLEIDEWVRKSFNKNAVDCFLYLDKENFSSVIDIAISVTTCHSQTMSTKKALDGAQGMLVYESDSSVNILDKIRAMINSKQSLDLMPLAMIFITQKSESVYRGTMNEILKSFVEEGYIASYKLYISDKKLQSLEKNTCMALKWLAKNYPNKPLIEMDLLKRFLHNTIGNELWYRLRLQRHTRFEAVYKDFDKMVALYNEAVERSLRLILNENSEIYPSFPPELKQYLAAKPYPKTYEYFPDDWGSELKKKEILDTIRSLKFPKLSKTIDTPNNYIELYDSLEKLINSMQWFYEPKNAFYEVIAIIPNELSNEDLTDEEFKRHFELYDYLDIFHVLTALKINKLDDNMEVFYDKQSYDEYRVIAWWESSELTKNVEHKALKYKSDSVDDLLNYSLDQKSKKMRYSDHEMSLSLSLEEKDEECVNKTISNINKSLDEWKTYKSQMDVLERSLSVGVSKSRELDEILRKALENT